MSDLGGRAVELAVTAVVLVAGATPALRVATSRPVRRELRAHPWVAALAFTVGAIVIALALWISIESVLARRVIVWLVALGAVLAWIHARPMRGTRRGLPPGSTGLGASLEAIDDPSFYARTAERFGPVFKMRQVHRPVACVTDLAIARGLLERSDESLGQSEWAFNRLIPGGYLEYMEGGQHAHYRGVFAAAFTADAVVAARDTIAAASREQLTAMARAAGRDGVHPEPFLYEVPFRALLHAVLGVTSTHPQLPALRSGFSAITVPMDLRLPVPSGIARGYEDLVAITQALAADGHDTAPSVLQTLVRQDPRHATDATVLGNLVLMVKEGSIMVRGLLRWILRALASDPSHARELREVAPSPHELETRAVAIVRETLRLHESRYLYRTARHDIAFGRFRVPRGWLVRLCLGEAHEDPRVFPDPQRFDPARFVDAAPGRDAFCPFGSGPHACLGDELTLTIAGGFVREAALGWDLQTVSDGPMWRINRHWGLWRPSNAFRLTLTPRNAPP